MLDLLILTVASIEIAAAAVIKMSIFSPPLEMQRSERDITNYGDGAMTK